MISNTFSNGYIRLFYFLLFVSFSFSFFYWNVQVFCEKCSDFELA